MKWSDAHRACIVVACLQVLGAGCMTVVSNSDDEGVTEPAVMTAGAGAVLDPVMGSGVTGRVDFVDVNNVSLKMSVVVSGCTVGQAYPVQLNTGTGCGTQEQRGTVWAGHGEGFDAMQCTGQGGSTQDIRYSSDSGHGWTLTSDPERGLLGRVVVVGSPPIACGVVQ